jgi:CRP/FNR family transcriptional regulator, cyclic AMP receptor protein
MGQTSHIDASASRIRLLDVDPDLGRYLTAEDLAEAHQLVLSVLTITRGEEHALSEVLDRHDAFAAIVLTGMVLEQIQVVEQAGMRLLGPGDIVAPAGSNSSMLVFDLSARVLAGTRLVPLGRELLLAARRWPGLTRGLYTRFAQQADRLATQLVICQLPRVDQRLHALMWLLAESWGRVTPAGTTLPLKLTHDVLGALIGARRPTVTLALRDLTERGALVRQDEGWLLLEPPTESAGPVATLRTPALLDGTHSWMNGAASPHEPAESEPVSLAILEERLASLRERHESDRRRFEERMRNLKTARLHRRQGLDRIRSDRISRSRRRSS